MSHPVNDEILEKLFEKWEIIPCLNGVGQWELSYDGECTHETFDKKFEAEQEQSLKETKVLLDDVDQGNYEYMPKMKSQHIDHVETERLVDLARERERDRRQMEMFDDPWENWSGHR